MNNFFLSVADNIACFVSAATVALLGLYFYDWTTPFQFKTELSEKDNPAFGVHIAGYIIGLMILVMGAASPASGELPHPVDIWVFGGLAVVLFRSGAIVTDKLILPAFSDWKEISEDRNIGVGFVTAGVFIATGSILKGALTGDSSGLLMGILTTVEYFIFSQIILVAASSLYAKLRKYKHNDGSTLTVIQELRDNDNPAVGLSFAGFIVGASLVVSASIDGNDITSLDKLFHVLWTLLASSVLGVGSMLLIQPFVDKAVLPYASVSNEVGQQKNMAIAGVNAAFYVGLGLILYSLTA